MYESMGCHKKVVVVYEPGSGGVCFQQRSQKIGYYVLLERYTIQKLFRVGVGNLGKRLQLFRAKFPLSISTILNPILDVFDSFPSQPFPFQLKRRHTGSSVTR